MYLDLTGAEEHLGNLDRKLWKPGQKKSFEKRKSYECLALMSGVTKLNVQKIAWRCIEFF